MRGRLNMRFGNPSGSYKEKVTLANASYQILGWQASGVPTPMILF